jgi:hypothetical protein
VVPTQLASVSPVLPALMVGSNFPSLPSFLMVGSDFPSPPRLAPISFLASPFVFGVDLLPRPRSCLQPPYPAHGRQASVPLSAVCPWTRSHMGPSPWKTPCPFLDMRFLKKLGAFLNFRSPPPNPLPWEGIFLKIHEHGPVPLEGAFQSRRKRATPMEGFSPQKPAGAPKKRRRR